MKKIDSLMPASDREKHLKEELQRLESILLNRKKDAGRISDVMEDVLKHVRVATPPKISVTVPKNPKVDSPIVHVVQATDWHIGEVVEEEQVEGFNAADHRIISATSLGLQQAALATA